MGVSDGTTAPLAKRSKRFWRRSRYSSSFSNPSELEIASSFSRWANVAVIGSVLGCGGDDGFLDNGFVPLTIDEGPVEGRSFLRTAAPGGLLLTGMYLSPGRWVPGEREDANGDEMTSRSFPLDFP